jgi:hypothetical protein
MRQGKAPMALNFLVSTMLALLLGAAPAWAVEQCRFIQAKPEPAADTGKLDSLKQLREEDDAVYKSMRGICRGC